MCRGFISLLVSAKLLFLATSPALPQTTKKLPNLPKSVTWQPANPETSANTEIPAPTRFVGAGVMPDGIYQTKTSAAPYPFPGVGPPNFVDPLVPVGINGLERPPGFFSAFEIGLIHPTINGELVGTAPVSGVNVPVILAPANLDWTGAPRFTLGYHFASNAGSAVADYRLFASEGTKDFATFGNFGAAFQTTRLDWQSIDLGYNTPDLAPQPLLDVRADLNLRIGAIYYDHFLRNSSFQQKARNQFVGVGPVAAINATHRLGFLPQLALYGQIEGGVLIGGIEQSFEEIRSVGPNQFVGGARDISETGAVPVFGVEAGLSFIPKRGSDWFRFTFGYVYEQWFGTGNAGLSSGDVYFQGLFFRGEFNY